MKFYWFFIVSFSLLMCSCVVVPNDDSEGFSCEFGSTEELIVDGTTTEYQNSRSLASVVSWHFPANRGMEFDLDDEEVIVVSSNAVYSEDVTNWKLDMDKGDIAGLKPDAKVEGVGSVLNRTGQTFGGAAGVGKAGKLDYFEIKSGLNGGIILDVDFLYASTNKAINGKTSGVFKIGSNEAALYEDRHGHYQLYNYRGYYDEECVPALSLGAVDYIPGYKEYQMESAVDEQGTDK